MLKQKPEDAPEEHLNLEIAFVCQPGDRRHSISDENHTLNLLDDLAAARREKGLTQEMLAERVKAGKQAIYRMEMGVGSFPLMIRVMEALDYHIVGLARGASLAEQFRHRREKLKLSKAEVARRAGIMVNTVAALEDGGGSIASAVKVLGALGTTKMRRKEPTFTIVTPLKAGEKDKRFTPVELLTALEAVWGPISLDPCGHVESPVVADRRILLSESGDGLVDEWRGHFVFANPPFSGATAWMRRANEMHTMGIANIVCMLTPAKVDNAYFQTHLVPHCDVIFFRGRLQFGRGEGQANDKRNAAPFPTMLLLWGARRAEIEHFRSLWPCVVMEHDKPRPREIEAMEDAVQVPEFG